MFATTNDNQQPRAEPNETVNVPVAVRGTRETYEARETLKRVGLRWNPTAHVWGGAVPVQAVSQLKGMGLPVVELVPEPQASVDDPVAPTPVLTVVTDYIGRLDEARKAHGRCHINPRTGATVWGGIPERIKRTPKGPTLEPFGQREFDDRDIVANLPDDSREEQERTIRRFLRDLRLRVKGVRALMSADPSIVETLASNPEKARAFYAIHHVTRDQVEHGVPDMDVEGMEWADVREQLQAKSTMSWASEDAERLGAALPGSEEASA
jgi:hypothetical protein